jgi:NAD(P)H-dependent FMN reductase
MPADTIRAGAGLRYFVSYGSVGGARAIEHLRAVCSELQVAHVRQSLSFSMWTDFEGFTTFVPDPRHDEAVVVMFDQLESWTEAIRSVRQAPGSSAR